MNEPINVSLPAPIASELWTKIDQAQGIVNLAKAFAQCHLCGELEASLGSSLEAASDLLVDARRLVDKLR
ncbi:hypothetical protein IQ218_17440 [Synechocystis salina LEGE 06099]|uniref:hypothetical protein n=1 Tax=Synechocystis salina TaxID=945780 RepID=UPI0018827C71|nr:hypothetical protein [Synechocystis salina]MBE9204885.1 hypothetical protein [Synechocystis salina LEGE 06099]